MIHAARRQILLCLSNRLHKQWKILKMWHFGILYLIYSIGIFIYLFVVIDVVLEAIKQLFF